MTFHGVFGWVQQKDNYPVNQYGLKNSGIEPPHHFVYLYRNHYSEAERPCVQFLETLMREADRMCATKKNCGATTRYRTDGIPQRHELSA